jgi:hypothetical protein
VISLRSALVLERKEREDALFRRDYTSIKGLLSAKFHHAKGWRGEYRFGIVRCNDES